MGPECLWLWLVKRGLMAGQGWAWLGGSGSGGGIALGVSELELRRKSASQPAERKESLVLEGSSWGTLGG